MPKRLILFVVLALPLVIGGCGQKETDVPSAKQLIEQSKLAMDRQPGADIDIRLQAQSDGQTNNLPLAKDVTFSGKGQIGRQAAQIKGSLQLSGQTIPVELKAASNYTAIKINQNWAFAGQGMPDLGLRAAPGNSQLRFLAEQPQNILTGTVETNSQNEQEWLLQARLNPETALYQAKSRGLAPEQQKEIKTLADNWRLEVAINKKSYLPSTIKSSYSGPGAGVTPLGGIVGASGSDRNTDLSANIQINKWGVTPRPGPKPELQSQSLLQSLAIIFITQASKQK